MKRIKSILLTAVLCLSLSACGKEEKDNFDKTTAFDNMKSYYTETFNSEDYYLQISKTQSDAQTMTEAVKSGSDCAYMEYDFQGAIKFFRNGKHMICSPETFFQVDTRDAKWEDFSYDKTAEKYKSVLTSLCNADSSIFKEITFENSENKQLPYKVTAQVNLDNIDEKALFGNSGNFGSVSIKFLTDSEGKNFDDISLYAQYDYNSDIYIISATLGEANLPDEKGNNGQRPEDIENEYNKNLQELQDSYEQYLEQFQSSYQATE